MDNPLSPTITEIHFENTTEILNWLDQKRKTCHFFLERIPFDQLGQWRFKKDSGNLVHKSGKYFSIQGIRISTNFGLVKNWDQPIIYQPEVGILGILVRKINGVYHFLMQCKAEPGNPNIIQLAPTVQATVSNYTLVHNGHAPAYIDFFLKDKGVKIWIDKLQTGQGARFFQKQNRNMILELDSPIKIHEGFCWLPLSQIKELLAIDNMINDEARSVIACLPPKKIFSDEGNDKNGEHFSTDLVRSMHDVGHSEMNLEQIQNWIDHMKREYWLDIEKIPLKNVSGWHKNTHEITHQSKRFFSIVSVSVNVESREVSHWAQPLITDNNMGMVGFIVKRIKNVLHFLVQAKVEPGNINIIELAPTVMCSSFKSRISHPGKPEFLEFFLDAREECIRYSTVQSEEGGRFFCVQNKYMIIEVEETELKEIPVNYAWITLGQMIRLVEKGYLNIYARSLLAYVVLP